MTNQSKKMKRLLLTGAGFSHDLGMPLASDVSDGYLFHYIWKVGKELISVFQSREEKHDAIKEKVKLSLLENS
jgi:hypothetical protein